MEFWSFPFGGHAESRRAGEALVAEWGRTLNIKFKINLVDYGTYRAPAFAREHGRDMTVFPACLCPHPLPVMEINTGVSGPTVGWEDQRLEDGYKAARVAPSLDAYYKVIRDLGDLYYKEYRMVPLINTSSVYAANPKTILSWDNAQHYGAKNMEYINIGFKPAPSS